MKDVTCGDLFKSVALCATHLNYQFSIAVRTAHNVGRPEKRIEVEGEESTTHWQLMLSTDSFVSSTKWTPLILNYPFSIIN